MADTQKYSKQTHTLIFLHMPKTAGSTLSTVVRRQYAAPVTYNLTQPARACEEILGLTPEKKANLQLLTGHMPFGLHELLPRPASYIVMLREPVDRVLSHYYHVMRNQRSPIRDQVMKMTIGKFVESGLSAETDNRMTKILAGEWQDHLAAQTACSTQEFELAKRNLDEWFPVVGLTEFFDESLIVMKQLFGWGNILYGKANVGSNRPSRPTVAEEDLAVIRAHNRYDIALYAHAKERLLAAYQEHDSAISRELRFFRQINRPYNALYQPYYRTYYFLLNNTPWLRGLTRRLRGEPSPSTQV